METVHDIRLLLAILAPLLGAGLVMATGRRPNVREACSLVAAGTLFALTASMLPDIYEGKRLTYTMFELLPGLISTSNKPGLLFSSQAPERMINMKISGVNNENLKALITFFITIDS